jgi:hypothetical protein
MTTHHPNADTRLDLGCLLVVLATIGVLTLWCMTEDCSASMRLAYAYAHTAPALSVGR